MNTSLLCHDCCSPMRVGRSLDQLCLKQGFMTNRDDAKQSIYLLSFYIKSLPLIPGFLSSQFQMVPHMKKELGFTKLTERIIGYAISVHKKLGPGFLEKIYEHALCLELDHQGIPYQRQVGVPILYRSKPCGLHRLERLLTTKSLSNSKQAKHSKTFTLPLSYPTSKPPTYRLHYGLILRNPP